MKKYTYPNKILKLFFSYFVLIALFQPLLIPENNILAQVKQKEQLKTTVAPVPIQKIEKYRQNNDFKYIKQAPAINFWGIVLKWFLAFLETVFSDNGAAPYIRYAIIILVIAFSISKIFGGDFSGIFINNKKTTKENGFNYGNDDIHKIDFEKEIKNAIKKQNFRLATRFLYLKLLKVLNEIEYISWQPGKTNSSYQYELEDTNISNSFKRLSGMYEYCWYGHFELNQAEFEQLSSKFESIFSSLKVEV